MPTSLHERPGFLLRRANQILMSIAEQETAKIGLTPPQHVHLVAIGRHGPLDQATLGRTLGVDRATVGQVVRRLEGRGLVARTLDRVDARRRVVSLTPAGEALLEEADAASIAVSERLLAGFGPEEQAALVSLLAQLVTTLGHEAPEFAVHGTHG